MHRRYVDLPWGQVHLTEAGDPTGALVVLVHQTPLSSRTYTPLLDRIVAEAPHPLHVVAPDTPGYGASDPAPADWTIDDYATGVWAVVEALGHDRARLLGQHTGAIITVQATAQRPDAVPALILQGLPVYTDDERADRMANYAPPYVPADDASHLRFIWDRLGRLYPELDALRRTDFVADYLLAGPDYGTAYRAVFTHEIRPALAVVAASGPPVTMLCGEGDLVRWHHDRLDTLLPAARHVVLEGSGDFAPLEQPEAFTRALIDALELP